MSSPEEAQRDAILARLAASRAEVRRVLEPPPPQGEGSAGAPGSTAGAFPRSRTMKMLMSGRGLSTLSALAGGLLLARPALAWRLLRLLPLGTLARSALLRATTAMRARRD